MRKATLIAIAAVQAIVLGIAAVYWGGSSNVSNVEAAHQGERIPFDASEWKTDFKKHSVPLSEIMSGGPPKDGIPAIDKPVLETVAAADKWLKSKEPVILIERAGDARAYPLQILIWHEIANDLIGGMPVSITFCPLCNTAIAFDRRLEGKVLDFGTTGKLRFSDLVMYDRQTESWWQQVTGEAIVGDLTGKRLTFLPAQIISWETFKSNFPQGKVLSRNTGHFRSYGQNPYVGYDDIKSSPFLYSVPKDNRLPPMERVVTVSIGKEDAAYPFSALEKVLAVNDTVDGKPIVVLFTKGVTSALDGSSIPDSRDIGTAAVFERTVGNRVLTFKSVGDQFTDSVTASSWTILGIATAGPQKGKRLTAVVNGHHFWFSWAVFRPTTKIYKP